MKKTLVIISIVALILSIATTLVVGGLVKKQNAAVGLWGGKWDDKWPIILSIQSTAESDKYKVRYQWVENLTNAELSMQNFIGHKTNNYIQAGYLTFRMTETNGMIYGDFRTPRMANLVRLDWSNRPSVNNADELLKDHGWSESAIPADEAFKKITGKP